MGSSDTYLQNLGEGTKRGQMGRLGVREGLRFLFPGEEKEGKAAFSCMSDVVNHLQIGCLHSVAAGML